MCIWTEIYDLRFANGILAQHSDVEDCYSWVDVPGLQRKAV